MDYLDELERVLDGKYRLVSMETYDVERVLDLLGRVGRYSSKALYLWTAEEGMRRLGSANVALPRTKTPGGMLEHIANTPHFGIYVLRDFNAALEDRANQDKLKRIATESGDGASKVVMFLGEQVLLPDPIRPFTLRARHQPREAS